MDKDIADEFEGCSVLVMVSNVAITGLATPNHFCKKVKEKQQYIIY